MGKKQNVVIPVGFRGVGVCGNGVEKLNTIMVMTLHRIFQDLP